MREQRNALRRLIRRSPGLKRNLEATIGDVYQDAGGRAIDPALAAARIIYPAAGMDVVVHPLKPGSGDVDSRSIVPPETMDEDDRSAVMGGGILGDQVDVVDLRAAERVGPEQRPPVDVSPAGLGGAAVVLTRAARPTRRGGHGVGRAHQSTG